MKKKVTNRKDDPHKMWTKDLETAKQKLSRKNDMKTIGQNTEKKK